MSKWIGAALLAWVAMSAAAQEVEKLGWMAGTWVQKQALDTVQESWLGPQGGVMVAVNLTQDQKRGTSFEFLRIASKDGRPVYFASPQGRTPVEFPLTEMTENSVVFENKAHDFPQRIVYAREGNDVLVAR